MDGVSKWIDILDNKGRWDVCRRIYCNITGNNPEDKDVADFLQAKGWL